MLNLQAFPFEIVNSIRTLGVVSATTYFGNGVSGYREDHGLCEIVIDNHGKAWQAMNGMLISIGTEFGTVPNYQDPRTQYNAVSNHDDLGYRWVDRKTGETVEERDGICDDPMAYIPPDRREEKEWATLMAGSAND